MKMTLNGSYRTSAVTNLNAVALHGCPTIIISNEQCSSRTTWTPSFILDSNPLMLQLKNSPNQDCIIYYLLFEEHFLKKQQETYSLKVNVCDPLYQIVSRSRFWACCDWDWWDDEFKGL